MYWALIVFTGVELTFLLIDGPDYVDKFTSEPFKAILVLALKLIV